MRRAYVVFLLLLAAPFAVAGCAAFIKHMKEAAAPEYLWKRQKVVCYVLDGKEVPLETDAAMQEYKGEPPVTYMDPDQPYYPESVTTIGVTFAGYTNTLLPVDVAEAIPKEYTKHLDSLDEIWFPPSGPFTVLKSKNGDWNREFAFALNESGEIRFDAEGPQTMMILSMLRLNRDEPLDNTHKYIYSIEDEEGNVVEVPAYTTRRNDVLFYDAESESASTPRVYAFKVPEGRHTYTIRFKYSDGGDILLKFFEARYR